MAAEIARDEIRICSQSNCQSPLLSIDGQDCDICFQHFQQDQEALVEILNNRHEKRATQKAATYTSAKSKPHPVPSQGPIAATNMVSHFNSRGELVIPRSRPIPDFLRPHVAISSVSPSPSIRVAQELALRPQPTYHPPIHRIRLCRRSGCGIIISPRTPHEEYCTRCKPLVSGDVEIIDLTTTPDPPPSARRRPLPEQSQPQPHSSVPHAPALNPLLSSRRLLLRRSSAPHTPAVKSRPPISASAPIALPQLPQSLLPLPSTPKILACATPSCSGLVKPGSGSKRCLGCVMRDWKSKTHVVVVPREKDKGKSKSVSWADGGDEGPVLKKARIDDGVDKIADVEMVDVEVEDGGPGLTTISGWDSDLTELSDEDEVDSDSDATVPSNDEPLVGCVSGPIPVSLNLPKLLIRIPARTPPSTPFSSSSSRLPTPASSSSPTPVTSSSSPPTRPASFEIPPSTRVPPQSWRPFSVASKDRRKCTCCNHVLPPLEEYRWKSCHLCRSKSRRKSSLTSEEKERDRERKGPARPAPDVTLRRSDGRCLNYDCGLWAPAGAAECGQCVRRRMSGRLVEDEPRNAAAAGSGSGSGKFLKSALVVGKDPKSNASGSPYPTYQCFQKLLVDLQQRLVSFLDVQSTYYYHRPSPSPKNTQSIFAFDGEFSVISLNLRITDRKDEVLEAMEGIRSEVERVGGVWFDPITRRSASAYGGLISRYITHAELGKRKMKGELEVVVIPDLSHRVWPGQRTVVRFRLVG